MNLLSALLPLSVCSKIADTLNEKTRARDDFNPDEDAYYEGEDLRGCVSEPDEDGDFCITIYPNNIPNGTRFLAVINCTLHPNV